MDEIRITHQGEITLKACSMQHENVLLEKGNRPRGTATQTKLLLVVESPAKPEYLGTAIHLGPLYILSFLEHRGIPGDFLDRNVDHSKHVDYTKYDTIGFSVTINNIKKSLTTALSIKQKKPDTRIIFGGPFASAYPKILMREKYIDVVVVGEAEQTFYEYLSRKPQPEIKGLYYRENDRLNFTGTRDWMQDLDPLPFPALDKIDIKKYHIMFSREWPSSYIITSRGCPYECTFCYHNMGRNFRTRSPNNVVDEIEWQVTKFGIKDIGIVDENFTLNKNRVIEICDEIIRRGIKVKLHFTSGIRADFIDEETMRKLKEAGLWVVNFAPESGSPKTIERLKKDLSLDDVKKGVALAKKHGVATEIFLLIGFPWENKEDYKKTLDLAFELDTDFVTLSKYIALPTTGLYKDQSLNEDNEAVFEDRSYQNIIYNSNDEASRAIKSFYRKWYSNPIRVFRIVKSLRLYSPNKIGNPLILRDIICNLWLKLKWVPADSKNGQ